MTTLSVEVRDSDLDQLAQIADAEFRSPEQQAAAFVHQVLSGHRARANAPEKAPGRRGRPAVVAA